jgi:hypothetical protein
MSNKRQVKTRIAKHDAPNITEKNDVLRRLQKLEEQLHKIIKINNYSNNK